MDLINGDIMNRKKGKIIIDSHRSITREILFKKNNEFHKEQAKLPFEEKIRILVQLQSIANSIRKSSNGINRVWKITIKK